MGGATRSRGNVLETGCSKKDDEEWNAKGCFYADQRASIGSETKRRRSMNWLYLVGIIVFWFILNRWILPRMGVQT